MEVRVPGADMNPHFAISAIFLLGLRGIRKQIPLTLPPVTVMREKEGKERKSGVVKLARTLEEATKLFGREGSVAREVFGDEFVEHYKGTREHEVKLWNETVTNWEGMWFDLSHLLICSEADEPPPQLSVIWSSFEGCSSRSWISMSLYQGRHHCNLK
jgi:Glutamine synthetase, catalytic domain